MKANILRDGISLLNNFYTIIDIKSHNQKLLQCFTYGQRLRKLFYEKWPDNIDYIKKEFKKNNCLNELDKFKCSLYAFLCNYDKIFAKNSEHPCSNKINNTLIFDDFNNSKYDFIFVMLNTLEEIN
jgi:hypothetical protein